MHWRQAPARGGWCQASACALALGVSASVTQMEVRCGATCQAHTTLMALSQLLGASVTEQSASSALAVEVQAEARHSLARPLPAS